MVVGTLPQSEFPPRQNMGVDLPPKRFAQARKEFCHRAQSDGADHHQVHIALRARIIPREGTEDKRKLDPRLLEGIAENVCQSRGFQNEVSQIGVNRAVPVGSVIKPITIPSRRYQSGFDQPLHFQLNRPEGKFRLPDQFPEMKFLGLNSKQQTEHLGFSLGSDNIK